MSAHRTIAALALASVVGCGGSQPASSPSDTICGHGYCQLQVSCVPSGSNVSCTASEYGTDVTARASWSISQSVEAPSPSFIAVVLSPGLIAPVKQGNIGISASVKEKVGTYSGAPSHTYAVDPNGPAIPLCPVISGFVFDDNSNTFLPGALVEIIDGPDNGKSGTARPGDSTYYIEHIRMGIEFTMRASKPGYVSQTLVHRAITDDGPFAGFQLQDFRLTRVN